MDNFKTLSIDDKQVRKLYANGKLTYASFPDARHIVNEEAYGILSSDTVVETLTYNNKSYNVYDSIYLQNTWTDKGTGNVRPWLVSDSVMMFAQHWNSTAQKSFDVVIDGQTITIQSLAENAYVNLRNWCLENGYSESDLPNNNYFNDIAMIKCNKPSVSLSSICPYFMSEPTMKRIFWSENLDGVVGFSQSQATNYAIPVRFGAWNSDYIDFFQTNADYVKEENLKSLSAITQTSYPRYTGDSGKPKFIRLKGKDIVVTQCYSISRGANFITAFPFIKAFVESYGDSLNVFTPDMAFAT